MQRILVIRRDNIGDLACTTPMIHLLRRHFPNAWIGALVTHYNAPVLAGNTDLDEVLHYRTRIAFNEGSASHQLIVVVYRWIKEPI
jgi:ADP-heptose:LPS heptosyltransferase